MTGDDIVYAVHAIKPDEVSTTTLICTRRIEAENYANELSRDPGVLAGAVAEYVLDEPGRRSGIALYVQGRRQDRPHVSDDRRIFSAVRGPRPTHT